MFNDKQLTMSVLKTLLYVILIGLYVVNPLEKQLPQLALLLFIYALIGLLSFWNKKLFYEVWCVVSIVLIGSYFFL